MAKFGKFSSLRRQILPSARFAAAFDYVAEALRPGSAVHQRILAIDAGVTERHELAGGAFALEQVYHAKPRPEGFFESHRKYIDVQVIVAGAEVMEVADIAGLSVSEPYVPERDLIKYADAAGASRLILRAGDAALFFPDDGHMPSLRIEGEPTLVRKTVVKVPVE
jgi:YhcH/YjgK/YiaL family protein